MTQQEASEQEKFNAWWDLKGTNSVILRAQAWSAWLARAEVEQQPQPAEDPDEWVILDPVKYANHVPRVGIDQFEYAGRSGQWITQTEEHSDETVGQFFDSYGVYHRCRRRDLPKVQQVEQAKQCISHDEHRGEWRCKNAALPGKDYCSECADDPQPQKTRVRLWKNNYGSVMSNDDCEHLGGWQEIHHDSEGFYVE